MTDSNIDNGKAFDWGRTSQDYAKYRDIYPDEFYRKITTEGFVYRVRMCLISERVQALFRVICSASAQSGQAWIFHRSR